jgi:hypothetical protein
MASALSTLKSTVLCELLAPTLTAVIGVSDAGQKYKESGLEQVSRLPSGKNKPLEPLSIKLEVRLCPVLLRFVVKLSLESTVNTVALPRILLVWVPIPKSRDPLAVAAAPESGGN